MLYTPGLVVCFAAFGHWGTSSSSAWEVAPPFNPWGYTTALDASHRHVDSFGVKQSYQPPLSHYCISKVLESRKIELDNIQIWKNYCVFQVEPINSTKRVCHLASTLRVNQNQNIIWVNKNTNKKPRSVK